MILQGKYKYLIKNIGLLTLSSLATKLLSFFLVPLYTNILSTTQYGTYDLLNNTVGLLVPILTFNITDALFRYVLDENFDNKAVTTVAIRYFLLSCFLMIFSLFFNHVLQIFPVIDDYAGFIFLMFLTQNLSGLVTAYARGRECIRDLAISSVIASGVVIFCNIIFLVVFKWEFEGYIIANVLGPLVQSLFLIFRTRILCDVKLRKNYRNESKVMLSYATPLITNSIAWWVNSASDRYVITYFLGLSENGIYSVASKIPSLLNIIQGIFSQAWNLSVVKDYDPDDKNGFFKNTYSLYNAVMVICCSGIILFDRVLAKLLYSKEFYSAWKYVPWLTIAIVFGSLSGYLGGFFSAVKKSKIFAQSSVIGAISNIILNLVLTPFIGALGSAIATVVCYFIVWIIRLRHSRKLIRLEINLIRDIVSYVLLLIQSVVFLIVLKEGIVLYAIETLILLLIVFLYRYEIKMVLNKIVKNVGYKG